MTLLRNLALLVGLCTGTITLCTWLWKRKGAPRKVMTHQIERQREHGEARRREKAKENHAELLTQYVAKLRESGTNFVVSVSGGFPKIATYDDGSRVAFYGNLMNYKSAQLRGEHHGYDASHRPAPTPVSKLSSAELLKPRGADDAERVTRTASR